MYYESSDFLETADSDVKADCPHKGINKGNIFSDYGDTEKRTSILRGAVGWNRKTA